jgi:hypothetical protein
VADRERSGSSEKWTQIRHLFAAWLAALGSATLDCTSAMKPVRPDMVRIGS